MTRPWHLAAAIAASLALLAGCRPIISHDSIHRDVDRPADPAVYTPFLGVGGPGQADSPIQTPPQAESILPGVSSSPGWKPIDVPQSAAAPSVRVWINDSPADGQAGGAVASFATALPGPPTVKFEIDEQLGQFRGATIQIYRVNSGRADQDSGIRLSEPGEPRVLLPGAAIDLARLADGLLCHSISDNKPVSGIELSAGAEYELQVLVSGSSRAGVFATRVRIAPPSPPADTKPNIVPGEDEVDPGRLPPGVEIPR